MHTPRELADIVAALPTMDRERMSELWLEAFGDAPAAGLAVSLRRPVLAFQLQACARGLPGELTRQSAAISSPQRRTLYRAGTVLVREWGGTMHEVVVTSEGYRYQGEEYGSLSPIANRITGTRWSGPVFFGTKRKGQGR